MNRTPLLKHVLVGLLFLFTLTLARAQTPKEKIDAWIERTKKPLPPDTLLAVANQIYAASVASGYSAGEGAGLKMKGLYYLQTNDFAKSIEFYKEALALYTRLDVELEIAKCNLNVGVGYQNLSDFKQAIPYLEKSLFTFEKLGDEVGIGRVCNVLGIVCMIQKDYTSAKSYFLRYYALAVKTNDTIQITQSLNALGAVYTDINKIDSAIYYLQRAAVINKREHLSRALGMNYVNIGVAYFEKLKDNTNALRYFGMAEKMFKEARDDKFLGQNYVNLGDVQRALKDTLSAEASYRKALRLGRQTDDKETLREANKSLAAISEKRNDYKSAYEQIRQSVAQKDSMLNQNTATVIEGLKVKYDTYKKQQQIGALRQAEKVQRLELERRNMYLIIASIVIIFGTATAFLVYNRNKLQARARIQQEINKQQEITAREVLNAEERERRRIARDLHDGVGQLLSAALMNLNGLIARSSFSEGERDLADKSLALVSESYDEMRSLSHQIMPNALLKAGLYSAIKEFVDKIDRNQLRISLEVSGIRERMDEQTETVLYRVVQETVNNVIKHAGADELKILLLKDSDGISLTIEDNGRGFNTSRIAETSGAGLRNIQSRVNLLKGTVEYDSQPGKGTLVVIYVPAEVM